ncbi:MAG: TolC family protein [Desulfomonilaceae bacterium]|nr:TolC family protein [Desulfomonilaceae bacterium]
MNVRAAHVAATACACASLVLLTSCNPSFLSYYRPAEVMSGFAQAVHATKVSLKDPFAGPDPVALTQQETATTLISSRVRPASTVTNGRPLRLEDCRRIALATSLEIQQARIETLTQQAIEDSNRTRMLPKLILSAELSERDNLPFSYSEILGAEGSIPDPGSPGTGVNQFSTGRERTTWRYVLETRWSPTDAALAYYLTRSSRNDKTKQHYIRVRIAQKLLEVVDSSYFRLLSLQHVIPMAEKLVSLRTDLAGKSERLFEKKLIPVENYHSANKKLIHAQRILERLVNEAEQQRNLLASAMNVSPDVCADGGLVLVGDIVPPCYTEPICNMEMVAVRTRPEAYHAGLDHLKSVNDLKRTLVKYFPKVSVFWRYTRDKDKHLYNRDWKEVGGLVYFDLIDWAGNVSESRATELMVSKTRREIGAVAMGITRQVRTAALRYFDGLDEIRYAERALKASRQVLRIQRDRVGVDGQDRLALLESEGDVLQEEIERIRSIGEANGLLAELKSAMGTNYNEPLVR